MNRKKIISMALLATVISGQISTSVLANPLDSNNESGIAQNIEESDAKNSARVNLGNTTNVYVDANKTQQLKTPNEYIYPKEVTLYFEGKGVLDGKPITSGTKVTDPGVHTIEITRGFRKDITSFSIINNINGREITAISAYNLHSAAIDSEGNLYTWGHNNSGQLGDGTTTLRAIPAKINGKGAIAENAKIMSVNVGGYFTTAVDSEGNLYTWGLNSHNELGDGTDVDKTTPVKINGKGDIPENAKIMSVGAGEFHSAAIDSEGNLYTWGENSAGKLGDGTDVDKATPVKINGKGDIPENAKIISVSAGEYHTIAIDSEGNLYTWGNNNSGQLGDGTETNRKVPVKINGKGDIPKNAKITSVGAGEFHSAAIDSEGNLYTWGRNDSGQLGDGTNVKKATPVKINGKGSISENTKIMSVSAGNYHTAVIDSEGNLYSWGSNSWGELCDGSSKNSFTPVEAILTVDSEIVEKTSDGTNDSIKVKVNNISKDAIKRFNIKFAYSIDNGVSYDFEKLAEDGTATIVVPTGSSIKVALVEDHTLIENVNDTLSDGSTILPGGVVTKPDGSVVLPGQDGTLGNKDDVTVKPGNGQKPTVGEDGNVTLPGGGTVVKPGGEEVQVPEGTVVKPDGTIIKPVDQATIESNFKEAYWDGDHLTFGGTFDITGTNEDQNVQKVLKIKNEQGDVVKTINTWNASWNGNTGYQCFISKDDLGKLENGNYKLFVTMNLNGKEYESPVKQAQSLTRFLVHNNINKLESLRINNSMIDFSSDTDNNVVFSKKESSQLTPKVNVKTMYFIESGLVVDGNFGFENYKLDSSLNTKLVLKNSNGDIINTTGTWNAAWGEKNTGFQGIISKEALQKLVDGEYTLYAQASLNGSDYETKLTTNSDFNVNSIINDFKISVNANNQTITVTKDSTINQDSNAKIKESYWDDNNFVINGVINIGHEISDRNLDKKVVIKDAKGKVVLERKTVAVDWFSNKGDFSGFQVIIPQSLIEGFATGQYSLEVNTTYDGVNYSGSLKQEPSLLRIFNVQKDVNNTEGKVFNNKTFKFATDSNNSVILNVTEKN